MSNSGLSLLSGPLVMVVGFSTTQSWLSRTIRWGTKSKVSHSYMRFSLGLGPDAQDVVLHADYRGIEVLGMKRFSAKNKVVAEFTVDVPWRLLIAEIIEELGTPYDFWGLLGQGVMTMGTWFGKTWENPFQDEHLWYCSEFCAFLLEVAGEELPAKPAAISPQLLLTIMQKSPRATRIPERQAA